MRPIVAEYTPREGGLAPMHDAMAQVTRMVANLIGRPKCPPLGPRGGAGNPTPLTGRNHDVVPRTASGTCLCVCWIV